MDVIISDESSGSESDSSDSDDHSAFMEHMNVMSICAKPYQFEPFREDIYLYDIVWFLLMKMKTKIVNVDLRI